MAEDMSLDLSCYGMPAVKTPVLDKLASDGILYYNAMSTNPISSPSRSAMMSGVHQDMIDAHNHRSNRDKPLRQDVKPFTYYLRQNGYTCILGNNLVYTKGEKIDCNYKTEAVGPYDGINHFGLFDKKDEFTKADEPFFSQIQLKRTHRGDWWKETTELSKHPVNPNDVAYFSFNNLSRDIKQNMGFDLDFVHRYLNNSKLSFNTHYTNYDYRRKQAVSTDYFLGNSTFDSSSAFKTRSDQVPKQFRNTSEQVPKVFRTSSETVPKRFRTFTKTDSNTFRACSEQFRTSFETDSNTS